MHIKLYNLYGTASNIKNVSSLCSTLAKLNLLKNKRRHKDRESKLVVINGENGRRGKIRMGEGVPTEVQWDLQHLGNSILSLA